MITNNDFVSRVANNIRALSKDSHISRRFILRVGRDKSKFLMSQKLDEMTMFKEEGIITTIECFRLHRLTHKSCDIFEFKLCNDLMRSEDKLPEGIFGKNGSGIVSITSVDGMHEYNYITPQDYARLSNRKYKRETSRHYYVKDGYLYLPDSTTELVEVRLFVLDAKEAEEACECNTNKDECKSIWDYQFICPDRFLDLVVKDTMQEIAGIRQRITPDENPNMDENQKSATTK